MDGSSYVVLIDDSILVHKMVEVWLRREQHTLGSAFTGEKGMDLLRQKKPDLILLDVSLPDTDGFELCRQIMADDTLKHVPIIFLTAATSTEQKIKGLDLGAVDYIIKPFNPAEFTARVRAALRTKFLMDLLAERAKIDGLTGLHNRAFFDERFAAESAVLRRTVRMLGVVMADIDCFKRINDTHGHTFGDHVLRGVAGVLNHSVRAEDVVCRYGGEEFAIIMPGVGVAGGQVLAERLKRDIAALQMIRLGVDVPVSASFGVAEAIDADGLATLLDRADAALYAAKQGGRNRVCVDEPSRQAA